jgi:acetamidase/formamidase
VERQLGPHILTGPIAVRGAEPGDALRIEILDIELADDWGFNLIKPDLGALPALFPYARLIHLAIDREAGRISTPFGVDIPARPFFGVMGTAPAAAEGRVTSVVPGSFGGNIDNKELVAGAVLTLPVAAPGGLLSIGDGHAAQGDGEVCLTAVETGLTGALRIELVKRAHLDAPFAETPSHLIAMAFDESLDVAAELASRRMIGLIEARTRLSAEDAYRLCSLAGDLRVTQVVNRKKGAHMMMPLSLIAAVLR